MKKIGLLVALLGLIGVQLVRAQSKPVGFGAGYSYHQGLILNATVGKWYGGVTIAPSITNWEKDFGIVSNYNNEEMASFQIGHAIINKLYAIAQVTSIWNENYVSVGSHAYDIGTSKGGDFGVGAQLMYLIPIPNTHFGFELFGGYDTIQTYTAGATLTFSFNTF